MDEQAARTPGTGSRGKWVVLAFAVIMVAAASYAYFYGAPPSYEQPRESVITAEEIEMVVSINQSLMRNLLLTKDSTLAACVAATEGDVGVCGNLESSEEKVACEDDYSWYVVFSSALDGDCSGLAGRDKLICDAVKSWSCEGLSGDDRAVCDSLLKKDVSACSETATFASTSDCENLIFKLWAMKNSDTSYCNSISHVYGRVQCKAFVSGNCDGIIDKISRDWIYFEISRELEKSELCDNIGHREIRSMCKNQELSYMDAIKSL